GAAASEPGAQGRTSPPGPNRPWPPSGSGWDRESGVRPRGCVVRREAVKRMELPLVVGVDGSEASLTAGGWAVDEAARHGVPLRLVYASLWERYEGAVPWIGPEPPSGELMAQLIVGSATERVRSRNPRVKVVAEVLPEDAVHALVRQGDTA